MSVKQRRSKRKSVLCHHFTHLDRNAVLEQTIAAPKYVTLSTGFYADLTEFPDRQASFIQKQLRQHLYRRLIELGKESKYILNLGVPTAARTLRSYVDLTLTSPMIGSDLSSNESFAREMITMMRSYFKDES